MSPSNQEPAGRFDQDAASKVAQFFDAETAGYRDDIDAIKAYARRTGGPLLELGCGTGRVLLPLARAGYEITGVDLSPAMLDRAKARLGKAGVLDHVTLLEGDFAAVALPGNYSFAFTVMNTFMHLLTQDEQAQALRHWHQALAPDGILLIDVLQPDVSELAALQAYLEFDRSWIDPSSGATILKQFIRTVDPIAQIMHITVLYDEVFPDGQMRRTVVPFDLRYMWRFEAELLLDKTGFDIEGCYGDWDLGPLDSTSERLILVGRRRP